MSTKDAVLLALQNAGSAFVSGEALAAASGVSRTSIWKAMQALEKAGYCIEAVSNHGYRLIASPDPVDAAVIEARMRALGVQPGAVSAFASIDSTLSESKRLEATVSAFRAADGSLTADGEALHRALIVAGQQTAGRGRLGRPFVSPANSGVYFTLVYAPRGGVTNPALLTAAAAVAVCRAVDALYGVQSQIKWVNDIFAGGKKICGILTEGFVSMERGIVEAANVGIGINMRPMGFTGTLSQIAGSLYEAAGCTKEAAAVSRNELVARAVSELLRLYAAEDAGVANMLREYRERSFLIGKAVQVNPVAGTTGNPYKATVLAIDDAASLVVQTESGETRVLQSGEVSLHSYDFAI